MLCFGYIIRTKCPFQMPTEIVRTTNVLHNLYLPRAIQAQAATALNSTLSMLMVEHAGRANLSGILKVQLYEVGQQLVPNPSGVPAAPRSALAATDHALVAKDRRTESGFHMTLTDTRRAIDEPVFEYVGLTQGERDAVYEAAYRAIVDRQTAEGRVLGRLPSHQPLE